MFKLWIALNHNKKIIKIFLGLLKMISQSLQNDVDGESKKQ